MRPMNKKYIMPLYVKTEYFTYFGRGEYQCKLCDKIVDTNQIYMHLKTNHRSVFNKVVIENDHWAEIYNKAKQKKREYDQRLNE